MNEEPDFGVLAGAYVDIANEQAKTVEKRMVGAALLHAAARYNTFVTATVAQTPERMAEVRRDHIEFYVAQFREALEHHYTEQTENFDAYVTGKTV